MRRVDIALEGKEHLDLLDNIRCGVIHIQRQPGAGEDTVFFPASAFEGSKNETAHILDVILLRLSQLPVLLHSLGSAPCLGNSVTELGKLHFSKVPLFIHSGISDA